MPPIVCKIELQVCRTPRSYVATQSAFGIKFIPEVGYTVEPLHEDTPEMRTLI